MAHKRKLVVKDESRVEGQRKTYWLNSYRIVLLRKEFDANGQEVDEQLLQEIIVSPWIYTMSLVSYAILNIIGLVAATVYGSLTTGFSWGAFLVVAQFLYFIASFSTVKTTELGGLLFFGRIVREVDSGLFFAPIGLFELVKLPKNPTQEQFPGDPEKIFKKGDKEYFALTNEEREKLILPIRVLTGTRLAGEPKEDESAILDSQMTIEVTAYVRMSVEQFWVFFIRMSSFGEAIRQLRDTIERVLTEEVAKRTPREVVAQISQINERLTQTLEEVTEDWGVRIYEAAMLSPDLTHSVNQSLQSIVVKKAEAVQIKVTANADAYTIKAKADADKHRLTAEGKGRAAAKQAELVALAKGAKELGVSGESLVDLEKARVLGNGKTTVFIDGGGSGGTASLFGVGARLATGGAEALKSTNTDGKE